MPFEVGQSAGDYEILSVLGKGGMGRVYRVRNVISNRVEAMKVLLADLAAEAELGERFIGEIRTLARFDHPNIAKFHTAFRVENQLVMIMEFVEGFTLSDRAKEGPLPLNEVLSYVTQVLAALGYAHANGVIHRDIKPSNVMVTPHGIVKLMDFGIAKSNSEPLLTRPGTTMGSMLYMSPEQVRGETVDARSDLYALGVLLYELSAGRRPFEAENTYAILEAQLNTMPKAPLELNAALPQALNDIIMTALAKEPMHRFQSADAFRNALESVRGRERAAQAQTVSAPPKINPPLQQPSSALAGVPPRSNRGLWMAAGAIACVCVLLAGALALPHFWRSSAAGKSSTPAEHATVIAPPSATQVTSQAAAPVTPPPASTAQNQADNSAGQTASGSAVTSPQPVHKLLSKVSVPGTVTPAAPPAATLPQNSAPPPQAAVPPPGPSPEEIEKVNDDLIKLHARSDAVRSSLDRLRQQQAAEGLGLRQDIAASASRLDAYLQASDRAAQSNDLQSARRNIEHAEQEVNKLETFFGR